MAGRTAPFPPSPWEPGRGERPASGRAPSRGLTATDAEQRRVRYGPNEIETGQRFWALRPALEFSTNPLVLILLAASLVSGLLDEALNAALIAAMVALSVILNFY